MINGRLSCPSKLGSFNFVYDLMSCGQDPDELFNSRHQAGADSASQLNYIFAYHLYINYHLRASEMSTNCLSNVILLT
jgi:hypothetical protein